MTGVLVLLFVLARLAGAWFLAALTGSVVTPSPAPRTTDIELEAAFAPSVHPTAQQCFGTRRRGSMVGSL